MSAEGETGATKRYGEYHREQAEREQQWRRREVIRQSVRHVNRRLAGGDYAAAARICRERLAPALDVDVWALDEYHDALAKSPLAWDWEAINRFLDGPGRWQRLASAGVEDVTALKRTMAKGGLPAEVDAKRVIHHAAKSLESIAVAQGSISATLTQSSAVLGYTLQLGQQWHGWEFDNDDEVEIVNPDLHPPFTMCIGDPGNGKSTAVETLAEDAYQAGQKIIDLVDFSELENAVYDVESRDDELRSIRENYGLPASFDEAEEYDRPHLEILHPLCEEFCEAHLPYDEDGDRWVATPFVIPVADLDHSDLKAILGDLSPSQEIALDQALAALDDDADWSLQDLAEEVRLTASNEGVKRRLLTRLDTLNSKGFFATSEHEHAIDWDRIFRDTRTITVFSCSMLDQTEHKLMAVTYLMSAIFDAREPDSPGPESTATSDYPTAMLVGRELQKVAPSDRKMKGNTNTEQRLKSRLISHVQKLGEERRHVDLGISADTQQWVQVNKGIRENVDRVVMFKLGSGAAAGVFSDMAGKGAESYADRVSGFDKGEACVLGAQWLSTGRDFEMPITWIPPLCHHLDAEDDDQPDGWRARQRYKDGESLEPSPFDIDVESIDAGGDDDDPAEITPDGFEGFADLVRYTGNDEDRLVKADVYAAYCEYAERHGLEDLHKKVFGRHFRAFYPKDVVPDGRSLGGDRQKAYLGVTWTQKADPYREDE